VAGLAKVVEASQASDPKQRKTRKPHKHKEKPQTNFRVIRKRTKTCVFVRFRITRLFFVVFPCVYVVFVFFVVLGLTLGWPGKSWGGQPSIRPN
jgi:hypothetical protein